MHRTKSGIIYPYNQHYLSEQTQETCYQCYNLDYSCTFKTVKSPDKIITRPPAQEIPAPIVIPPPTKRHTLGQYGDAFRHG
ncbi:transcriptional regulator [Yersinia mollaretii]|nr:transcriptional regulator [Yersinia mollaretii]MDN0110360.1 transcriptional regulator [Yersinia mollaretii]PJE87871.1 transcriptional regulator [Yersinia mollaretii]